jgi:hypothetical protein
VEELCKVVTGSAEQLGFEMLQRIADPFATGRGNPVFAGAAPGIGSLILWIGCPEEADALTSFKAVDDVLAHEGRLLRAVNAALDGFHTISTDHIFCTRIDSQTAGPSMTRGRLGANKKAGACTPAF